MKTKFTIGDAVAFAPSVIARTGHNKLEGDARGREAGVLFIETSAKAGFNIKVCR